MVVFYVLTSQSDNLTSIKPMVTVHVVHLQDYKVQFADSLQSIEDEKLKLIHAEDRWMESWNKNIEKVRELF